MTNDHSSTALDRDPLKLILTLAAVAFLKVTLFAFARVVKSDDRYDVYGDDE